MLIRCPECGKEISDKAAACPSCGCPASVWQEAAQTEEKEIPAEPEKTVEYPFAFVSENEQFLNLRCSRCHALVHIPHASVRLNEAQGTYAVLAAFNCSGCGTAFSDNQILCSLSSDKPLEAPALEKQAEEGTEKKHSRNRERALYAGVAVLFIMIGIAFVRVTNNRNQALHEEINQPATVAPKTEYQPVSTPARPSSSVSSASSSTADSVNTARHTNAEAFTVAQDIVEKNLKSPSTAEFCKVTDAEITHLGNGEYMVYGWVDAQNGYGTVLRTNFLVTYTAIKQGNDIGYKNGNVIFD